MDTGKQSDEELLELLAQAQKARERAKQQEEDLLIILWARAVPSPKIAAALNTTKQAAFARVRRLVAKTTNEEARRLLQKMVEEVKSIE